MSSRKRTLISLTVATIAALASALLSLGEEPTDAVISWGAFLLVFGALVTAYFRAEPQNRGR